tara:strand:- start:383 stop:856 length:474 start_codon:yes stop_codon:yes gene_type:complete
MTLGDDKGLEMTDVFKQIAESKSTFNGGLDVFKNYLKKNGIESFHIAYYGFGDDGDVAEVDIKPESLASVVPKDRFEYQSEWSSSEYESKWFDVKDNKLTFSQIIENIGWKIVNHNHGGWENNEGGQGTISYNTKDNKILLSHGQNYVETTETDSEF